MASAGTRRSLVVLLLGALVSIGLTAPPASAAPSRTPRSTHAQTATAPPAPPQIPGVASLADCVRSGRPLLALFLIDTSGSLQQTDPTNQRVAGVKTALQGLASLQANGTTKHPAQIDVQLDGFSVGLQQASQWTSLTGSSVGTLDSQADSFAGQNTGQDTDYYAALAGANQAIANEASAVSGATTACSAILWFTDGQYDVEPRLSPQAVATLGANKAYAPDIDLTMPGGGLQLIARGKQLLCEPGGLDDHMHAAGIAIVAVAIDTQIAPADQAFLSSVATGNGCGTPPKTPTGASLQTGDLSQLVLSFNAVANSAAGGTQLGASTTTTPCPGTPCASGTRTFNVDRTLNRVNLLTLAANAGINLELKAPGVGAPIRITAGTSGRGTLGASTIHFVWINGQTCSIDITLGAQAVGEWQIIFIGPATLTAAGPVQTQIHVYADITPTLLRAPTLRSGAQGVFDVSIANSRRQAIGAQDVRHATLTATATDPLTGEQQPLRVQSFRGGQFHLLYTPNARVASITVIQITLIIVTFGGIQLAPIQRTFRQPIELPAAYPRLATSEVSLNTPEGTGGDGALTLIGGTHSACVWIDPTAPQTSTPNTQVNYTEAPSRRSQCLKLASGQHRTLPLTVIPNPALPGVITTSVALHLVVVNVRVIVIIIPLTLTLTSQVLPQNGPTKRIVSLGDSYSSGEGNPPFDLDTIEPLDLCHRSPEAWPRLIGVDDSYLLACSGAKTINLTTNGQTTFPPDNVPQIQRLAAINAIAPVDAVTVMIGGNDIGFSSILGKCYAIRSCLKNPSQNDAQVDLLERTLQNAVLPAIKSAAPQAQVFLVSYPNVLPPKFSQVTGCAWLNSSAYSRMTSLEHYLLMKESAAARADAVTFVDTSQALSQHALCSADPWIHKIDSACVPIEVPGATAVDPAAAYCAHPIENATEHGQRAIGDVVQRAINNPAPTPSATSPPSTTPSQAKGGQGTITINGQIGTLQFGTSTESNIVAVAGPPDETAQSTFNAPNDPNYEGLGYNCTTAQNSGALPLAPQDNTSPYSCATIYYINVDTGTLAAFSTTSSNFQTPNGTRAGMPAAEAEQREQQQVTSGCTSGIGVGSQADSATIFIWVNSDATTNEPEGPVTHIDAESTQNPVGLLFC